MVATATEFKTNFSKYLELITKEDIFITRNGKTVAKVVNPQISAVDSLCGMLKGVPSDINLDSLQEERMSKYAVSPTMISFWHTTPYPYRTLVNTQIGHNGRLPQLENHFI